MDNNNETLVQDFIAEPGVFFFGIKPLNLKSVAAARKRDQVLPIVGRHLYREINAETCWNGGRIDHSRSSMNFSLLPDDPMKSEAMVETALAAVANNGIDWTKLRKDKIVGIELVISLPSAFHGDVRAFFVDSLAWVNATFPSPITVVAAVVHLDEAKPHMHVILIPIVGLGCMNGHQVVGYTSQYSKRVNSFHQQVAQRYDLRKPRPKVQLTYRERQQLADRMLVTMMADGPAWAASPAGVAAMRQMLTSNPTPMAKALGLMGAPDDDGTEVGYAVADAGGPGATAGAESTALLCYAVGSEAVLGEADGSANDGAVLPIYIANIDEQTQSSRTNNGIVAEPASDQCIDLTVEREDEQPVSHFNPDTGNLERPPLPARSQKTNADTVVSQALQSLTAVRRAQQQEKNHD